MEPKLSKEQFKILQIPKLSNPIKSRFVSTFRLSLNLKNVTLESTENFKHTLPFTLFFLSNRLPETRDAFFFMFSSAQLLDNGKKLMLTHLLVPDGRGQLYTSIILNLSDWEIFHQSYSRYDNQIVNMEVGGKLYFLGWAPQVLDLTTGAVSSIPFQGVFENVIQFQYTEDKKAIILAKLISDGGNFGLYWTDWTTGEVMAESLDDQNPVMFRLSTDQNFLCIVRTRKANSFELLIYRTRPYEKCGQINLEAYALTDIRFSRGGRLLIIKTNELFIFVDTECMTQIDCFTQEKGSQAGVLLSEEEDFIYHVHGRFIDIFDLRLIHKTFLQPTTSDSNQLEAIHEKKE